MVSPCTLTPPPVRRGPNLPRHLQVDAFLLAMAEWPDAAGRLKGLVTMSSLGHAVEQARAAGDMLAVACRYVLEDGRLHTLLQTAKAMVAVGSGKAVASKWFSLEELTALSSKRSPVDRTLTLLSLFVHQLAGTAPDVLAACAPGSPVAGAIKRVADGWPADASPADLAAALNDREVAVEDVAKLAVPSTAEWVTTARGSITAARLTIASAADAFAATLAFLAEPRLHKPDVLFKPLAAFMSAVHTSSHTRPRSTATATGTALPSSSGIRVAGSNREAAKLNVTGQAAAHHAPSGGVPAHEGAPPKLAALISRWNTAAGGAGLAPAR